MLYFTETEDFSTIDGLVEPLKMFAENIGGWLSVIFCVIISLGAMTLIMLALAVVAAYVIIIGPLLWFLTYIFLLFVVSVFITCYACYVSKQNIIARSLSE